MKYINLLLALCLVSCPTPGLHTGVTGVSSQEGYTMNTTQKLVSAADAVAVADFSLQNSIASLVASGYSNGRDAAYVGSRLIVGFIKYPEPCRAAGLYRGPCKYSGDEATCARKRGCSTKYFAWAALCWPPLCTDEWSDEPNCTNDKSQITTKGWTEIMMHEVFNASVAASTKALNRANASDNYYQNAVYAAEEKVIRDFAASELSKKILDIKCY